MKRNFVRMFVLMPFIGINWAALHDITSGEPNIYLEYLIISVSIILVASFLTHRYIKLKQNRI